MRYEKWGVLHFISNYLTDTATYALDKHRTLIGGNRIRPIEWYHLRAPITTGSARNSVRNQSNSARSVARPTASMSRCLSICWASCFRTDAGFLRSQFSPCRRIASFVGLSHLPCSRSVGRPASRKRLGVVVYTYITNSHSSSSSSSIRSSEHLSYSVVRSKNHANWHSYP